MASGSPLLETFEKRLNASVSIDIRRATLDQNIHAIWIAVSSPLTEGCHAVEVSDGQLGIHSTCHSGTQNTSQHPT